MFFRAEKSKGVVAVSTTSRWAERRKEPTEEQERLSADGEEKENMLTLTTGEGENML